MRVNLYLKDGNVIKRCNIYPEDVKNGDLPYVIKDQIDQALSKVAWGIKYVSFQTESSQGQVHVNNIERFEIDGTVTLTIDAKAKIIKNTSGHCFKIGEIVKFTGNADFDEEIVLVFENEYGEEQGLYIGDYEIL
jgi:hypothetical protein